MVRLPSLLLVFGLFSTTGTAAREPDAAIELFRDNGSAVCNLEFRGATKPPAKPALIRLMNSAMAFCADMAPGADISGSVEHDDTDLDIFGGVPEYDRRTKRLRIVPYEQFWAGAKKITGHD